MSATVVNTAKEQGSETAAQTAVSRSEHNKLQALIAQKKADREAAKQAKPVVVMSNKDKDFADALTMGSKVRFDPSSLQMENIVPREASAISLPDWTRALIDGTHDGNRYSFRWVNQHDLPIVLGRRVSSGRPLFYIVKSDAPFWDIVPEYDRGSSGAVTRNLGSGIVSTLVFTYDHLAKQWDSLPSQESRRRVERATKGDVGKGQREIGTPDQTGKRISGDDPSDGMMVTGDTSSNVAKAVTLMSGGEVNTGADRGSFGLD